MISPDLFFLNLAGAGFHQICIFKTGRGPGRGAQYSLNSIDMTKTTLQKTRDSTGCTLSDSVHPDPVYSVIVMFSNLWF